MLSGNRISYLIKRNGVLAVLSFDGLISRALCHTLVLASSKRVFFFRPDLRWSSVITRLFCFSGRSLRSGELNLRKEVVVFVGIINSNSRGCDGLQAFTFYFCMN